MEEIAKLGERLELYYRRFGRYLRTQTRDTREYGLKYISGLLRMENDRNLANVGRKTGISGQNLQYFVSNSSWSGEEVIITVEDEVKVHPAFREAILVLDESAEEKSGEHSAGAGRQHNGRLGKIEMSQVGVFLALVTPAICTWIDGELYLLMKDLVDYVTHQRGEVDALILAGIFHKQMVIIHPFMDGNGRTTRLATKVLLAEMGLNTFNLFSFENFYNQNVTRYIQTAGEFGNYYDLVDQIGFTLWLEYFTEGLIDELLRVQRLLPEGGKTPATSFEPYHLKIMETIPEKGFITDRDYAKLIERAKATRALDFQKLIRLGMIERKGRGRATYYVLKEVV